MRLKRKIKNKVRFFVKHGIRPLGELLLFLCPIASIWNYATFGDFTLAIMTAVLLYIVAVLLKSISYELNVSKEIPVPLHRFTTEDHNGNVNVKEEDISELILYMNDLENWFEREGYTENEQ